MGPSPKLGCSQMDMHAKFIYLAPLLWATLIARYHLLFQLLEFLVLLLHLHSQPLTLCILNSAIKIKSQSLFPMSFPDLHHCAFQLESFPKHIKVLNIN